MGFKYHANIFAVAAFGQHSAYGQPLAAALADDPTWLTTLTGASKTFGSAAAFFEHDPNAGGETWKSHAWSHASGVIGSLGSLISGFTSTDPHAKQIASIQREIDSSLDDLDNDLKNLLRDLDQTFLTMFLAPKDSKLTDASRYLSQYAQSSKSSSDWQTFRQQMDPVPAAEWAAMARCFTGQESDCPRKEDLYKIILHSGTLHGTQGLPKPPAVLQFYLQHYMILASSLNAICTYDYLNLRTTKCPSIPDEDKALLQLVAQDMSTQVQGMKSEFWSEMGSDKLTDLIQVAVDGHKNEGHQGAKVIRDIVSDALKQWFSDQHLQDWFGYQTYTLAVYSPVSGSDKHDMWARGYKYRYNGYNIMYDFTNDREAQGYPASACSVHHHQQARLEAECLHRDHGANVWCLSDRSAFWAVAYLGAYERTHVGGACMVNPGFDSSNSHSHATLPSKDDYAPSLAVHSEEASVVPLPAMLATESQVMHRPSLASADASSVFKDLSNSFATAAAVVTLFAVACPYCELILGVGEGLFGLLSNLIGTGQDAVTVALKTLETDVVDRISHAKQTVDEIRGNLDLHSFFQTINEDEDNLQTLKGFYHDMVSSDDHGATDDFVRNVDHISVSTYIHSWNFLVKYLDQSALETLAHHSKDWYRPMSLVRSVQYYVQLLQQTALAICTYALLQDGDAECKLLQGWNTALTNLGQEIVNMMKKVQKDFQSSTGTDRLPKFMDHFITAHANPANSENAKTALDNIHDELHDFFEDDGDTSFSKAMFGWDKYLITIYDDVIGDDKHFMYVTGHKFRYLGYNIAYSFESATPHSYSSSECATERDAKSECECLHRVHNAHVWCLRGDVYWHARYSGACFQEHSGGSHAVHGGGARAIIPGNRCGSGMVSSGVSMSSSFAAALVV